MADERIDELIAEFLEAEGAGRLPDRVTLLARHPDLADELRSFFADHDRMRAMAEPLHSPSPADTPTLGLIAPLSPGTTVRYFGDYEILAEIARGGMGVVYKARQVSLNRLVALKMIRQVELASEQEVRRFLAEAEAAAGLDHPHIVPIYEVGEHEGQHYFSMKLIQGGSLARHVQGLVRDPRAAALLLATVSRAVHYAHQRRLLHRDLKPANILLDDDGQPHVTDFGLAKVVESESGLTRSGQVMGTPSYMAPEQAAGHNKTLTTAADIYSLGAIQYELLLGRPPFQADSVLETLRQVLDEEPVRPRAINPAIDRDLETICLKCLAKDPVQRYGSAEALAEDLERWLRGEPVLARPVGALERAVKWVKRRPTAAALLAMGILMLLGGGLFLVAVWASSQQVALRAAKDELDRFRAEAEDERLRLVAEQERQRAAPERLGRQLARVAVLWELYPERSLALLEDAEECPPDLRDAAWVGLHRLCKFDRRALGEPGKPVVQLAGTADGRTLLVLKADGTLHLWDVVTGKEMRTLKVNVAYEPAKNGRPMAMSPDGRKAVFVRGGDGNLVGCDVTLDTCGEDLGSYVGTPAITPDGGTLAALMEHAADGVLLLDISTAKGGPRGLAKEGRANGPMGEPISAMAFAPDGKMLAAVTRDGTVQIWDVGAERLRTELKGGRGISYGLAFTPDGKGLAFRCDQPPDKQGKSQPPEVLLLDVPAW
jgi:tRNA A-37 threonylcarbamoyl transferase component Bud32